ncbi:TPA: DivIVA domain-containing protein [Candidatus Poribacteria bacterium]|nr:DivIVA domain-containing protein [Candidatus Poribacteria bacterium]
MLTALDIYQQEFKRSFRGYDPDEVESFLELVAASFEQMTRENSMLKNRVAALEEKIEEYRKKEESLRETLLSVQKFEESAKTAAQRESEIIINRAKLEAQKIIHEAEEKANRIREEINRLKNLKERFIAEYRALLQTHYELLMEMERRRKDEELDETTFMEHLDDEGEGKENSEKVGGDRDT